ncbi:unnamed protein product, partial [Durusdinium trenchii]
MEAHCEEDPKVVVARGAWLAQKWMWICDVQEPGSNRCGSPIRNPRRFRAECGAGGVPMLRRPTRWPTSLLLFRLDEVLERSLVHLRRPSGGNALKSEDCPAGLLGAS